MTWNCRGLRKKGVATFLKDLISQYAFHCIGLQETMIQDCDDKILRNFDCNQDYLWLNNPTKGKSGSILAGTKRNFFMLDPFIKVISCHS